MSENDKGNDEVVLNLDAERPCMSEHSRGAQLESLFITPFLYFFQEV